MMTMAISKIVVRVSVPWWAIPYVRCCCAFGMLFGMEPDMDKIARRIVRHIKVRQVKGV